MSKNSLEEEFQVDSRCFFSCILNAVYDETDLNCGLNSLQSSGPLKVILNWCLDVRVPGRMRLLFLCLVW